MLISDAIVVAMSINLGLSPLQIEKAATDYGMIDVTVVYDVSVMNNVNAAAAALLTTYLLTVNQGAGGFTVEFNTQEIKNRIVYLGNNSGGLFAIPKELQLTRRGVTAVRRW